MGVLITSQDCLHGSLSAVLEALGAENVGTSVKLLKQIIYGDKPASEVTTINMIRVGLYEERFSDNERKNFQYICDIIERKDIITNRRKRFEIFFGYYSRINRSDDVLFKRSKDLINAYGHKASVLAKAIEFLLHDPVAKVRSPKSTPFFFTI